MAVPDYGYLWWQGILHIPYMSHALLSIYNPWVRDCSNTPNTCLPFVQIPPLSRDNWTKRNFFQNGKWHILATSKGIGVVSGQTREASQYIRTKSIFSTAFVVNRCRFEGKQTRSTIDHPVPAIDRSTLLEGNLFCERLAATNAKTMPMVVISTEPLTSPSGTHVALDTLARKGSDYPNLLENRPAIIDEQNKLTTFVA
ncbi:hypothetical protein WN51_02583 [Melipona quadrifasciata]|uniref:Uncharacterized protein n=1 Tax=Melipona quadrifasciata TaxID=166423 RepID=A0A0M8ZTB1_9HYME|nr:hypothetical protein WN51_02583 [Melipona quadrifasciata]